MKKINKCIYKFDKYDDAKQVALYLTSLKIDSTITNSSKFLLKFSCTWEIERNLISQLPVEQEMYRSGNPYSREEIKFISEMFCCWHSSSDIMNAVKRSSAAITSILIEEDLLCQFSDSNYPIIKNPPIDSYLIRLEDLMHDFPIDFDADGYALPQESVEILQGMGIIRSDIKIVKSGKFVPLDYLDVMEITDLLSLLRNIIVSQEPHRKDAYIEMFYVVLRSHPDRIYRANFQRWIGCDPEYYFRILGDVYGLSKDMFYQRELARAFTYTNMLNTLPKLIYDWLSSKEVRQNFSLRRSDFKTTDFVIEALISCNDQKSLKNLALHQNNKLAAAILVREYKSYDYYNRGYNADIEAEEIKWSKIQGNYIPSFDQIRESLKNNINNFDRLYADKLLHVRDNSDYISQISSNLQFSLI